MNPLVVTLAIDDESQARFDAERRRYFPPGRTQVGAHVTLFHALPGEALERVEADLVAACRRPTFEVTLSEVYSLGRGVAYRLTSTDLAAVHGELRAAWLDLLDSQDAQPFRPHVTVQNKVTAETARTTLEDLAAAMRPGAILAVGLHLWHYVGGPWRHEREYRFPA